MKHVSSVSWLAVLITAGCAASAVDEQTADQAIGGYVPTQGRNLLGFHDSDVRTFRIKDTAVLPNGMLINSINGVPVKAGFPFVSLANNISYRMRIERVIAPTAPDTQWQYVLGEDRGNGIYANPCDDPTPIIPPQSPVDPEVRAYAFAGHWDIDGIYFRGSATDVSFACKTAVVGKCILWGYGADHAWPTSPPVTQFGNPFTGADVLAACSRMARADYCGTGLPNTLDGTPIYIDDMFTFKPTETIPGFPREAAWAGRALIRKGGPQPAVCLSKLRWATLPPEGDCPLSLPDPRIDGKGEFCEDMPFQRLDDKGALMYSSSSFIDAGLLTYHDPATRRHFTTASLIPGRPGTLPTWTLPSPPQIGFPIDDHPPAFEGTVFAAELPVALPSQPLVKVVSYDCDGQLVTSAAPQNDCKLIAVEGQVLPPGTPDRAPLRRWVREKESWTTTTAPSTMLPEGWIQEETLGGVLRAGLAVNLRWTAYAPNATYTYDVQTRTGAWITGCRPPSPTALSEAFTGRCTGTTSHVNHADVIAFRVVAQVGTTAVTSPAVRYDGVGSDVYVPFPGAKPWALTVQWNAVSDKERYRLWFDDGGGYKRCEEPEQLGMDTSYVHTGKCWLDGHGVAIYDIKRVMVCSVDDSGAETHCGESDWDQVSATLSVYVKP